MLHHQFAHVAAGHFHFELAFQRVLHGSDDRLKLGPLRLEFLLTLDLLAFSDLFEVGINLRTLGLVERQIVDLVSEWADGDRVAEAFIVVPFDLPRGNAATYFPEANPLVPLDSVADRSRTPTSKSIVIRIRVR